ncbi:MAG: sigma-70 family RNA polymerase sigma factor, partial [Rubrobacteridae bacterium]|nr:sigma-70 family RNA polymerase sigma factor [Rubrobacteridae bacterium]
DTAEDLAQDVFMKAYRSLSSFRGESKFSTWLVRIATNKALDYCRKLSRHAPLVSIENDTEANDSGARCSSADLTGHPELAYLDKERSDELKKRIDDLPDIYKKVLYQSAVDEMSCSEIAKTEGVPVKTIVSRLYRGRKLFHSQPTNDAKGGKKK